MSLNIGCNPPQGTNASVAESEYAANLGLASLAGLRVQIPPLALFQPKEHLARISLIVNVII